MQILVIGAAEHAAVIRQAIAQAQLSDSLRVIASAGRLTTAVLGELSQCRAVIIVVPRGSGFAAETRRECLVCWGLGATPVLAIESGGPRDSQEVRATGEAFASWAHQLGAEGMSSFELSQNFEKVGAGLRRIAESAKPAQPFRMWVDEIDSTESGVTAKGQAFGEAPAVGNTVAVLPAEEIGELIGVTPSGQGSLELALKGLTGLAIGQLIVAAGERPEQSDQVAAHLVWCGERPMLPGRSYVLRLGPQRVTAHVSTLKHRINPLDLDPIAARQLSNGEVGLVNLSFAAPILSDSFARSPDLGRFLLFDPDSDTPIAFGRIAFTLRRATNIHWQAMSVDKAARAQMKGQRPCCLWFTGLSGSGKSTVASLLEKRLSADGRHTYALDGDNVRHGLNRDLGFTDADRVENIRRVSEVAKLFVDAGLIVLVSFISPFRAERQMARDLFPATEFLEIFVDTPIEICEQRDPKGLYRKARAGALKNFTGIDSPYEAPERADIHLKGGDAAPDVLVETVYRELQRRGIV